MKFLIITSLSYLLLSAGIRSDHAIYLAVVQLDHQAGGPAAQLTIKVFTDDMQDALRNAYPGSFEPVAEAEFCNRLSGQAGDYFRENFSCRINGNKAAFTLKNCTLHNDVFQLEFEMDCPEEWQKVEVEADFFMELFPTQTNVLSIVHGEEKGYFRLTRNASSCTAEFD